MSVAAIRNLLRAGLGAVSVPVSFRVPALGHALGLPDDVWLSIIGGFVGLVSFVLAMRLPAAVFAGSFGVALFVGGLLVYSLFVTSVAGWAIVGIMGTCAVLSSVAGETLSWAIRRRLKARAKSRR